ncbi:hypothetical protein X777_05051 [Ooceraea biroi]|uniref:Uncharacterized protein n=1 Tax=Ooceraea biroi TaxID=2015173 RepID=A0A026WGD5_OOCBI|nr:hypothetical protein X777_05051 [Ooceraea biroi]
MLLKGRAATAKKYRRHHGKSGARSAAGKRNLAIATRRNSQDRRATLLSARSLLCASYPSPPAPRRTRVRGIGTSIPAGAMHDAVPRDKSGTRRERKREI